jgi:hypothetical protein
MKKLRRKLALRRTAVAAIALTSVVAGTHQSNAAQKKPAPKTAQHAPAKPVHHAPANHANQQKMQQQQAQKQVAQQPQTPPPDPNAGGTAPGFVRPPAAPVTPQDPAKLVGVAQAPTQGELDKRIIGLWNVSSSGAALGTLKISSSGEYVWKKDEAETKGKLVQVIPRKDSKTGVTYWKLKDEKQDFYAFISPDKPDRLSIFAVDTNAAAAEGSHDAAKASDKPAADSEKS